MAEKLRTTVLGRKVSYIKVGDTGPLVVILHGWPSHKGTWQDVAERLAGENFRVIIPDFPGFGESDDPPAPWGISEYASWAKAFLSTIDTNEVIVVGHSFGGRIAIQLAGGGAADMIDKLVLVAPSGVRHEPLPVWKWVSAAGNAIFDLPVLCTLKPLARKVLYRGILRRSAYYNAEGVMRESFKRVMSEETEQLEQILRRIAVPTLLLWGDNDATVPVTDGRYMAGVISGAGLQTIDSAGHSPQKDQPEAVAQHICAFLSDT